jgi:hypothetical protein
VQFFNIDPTIKLEAKVKHFIHDKAWRIPSDISHVFSNLSALLQKVHIPKFVCNDQLMWSRSKSDLLSFKDAYFHLSPLGQQIPWAKPIWNQHFPPSKSLVLWKWLFLLMMF